MIDKYKKLVNKIVEYFIKSYFDLESKDFYWVSNNIIFFGDYYIDFYDIIYCLENIVDKDKYFQYYAWCLDNYGKEDLTLRQWLLEPEERKRQEELYLNELKERVKTAEKELNDYINKTQQ